MTIAEQSPLNRHLGDGLNDTFVYTFSILADGDLVVFLDDTRLVQGNQYTLQNQTDVGGEVLFLNAPALDAEIVIKRETSRDQEVVYTPFDPFPAKSHEGALDKLTMLAQESFGRAQFGLPLSDDGRFWDGGGLRIDNVLSPISDDQVATKRYVDIQTDDPPPGSWDPDSDWETNGNWFNNGNWDFRGDLTYNGEQVAIDSDIPSISGLAEASVEMISTDTEVLTIGTPTLADDVDFTIRTQVANGLAKLNTAGKIPSEILDASGLEFLGVRDPADGLPVDATAGQFYVFVESGSISLLDSDGNPQLTDVVSGDTMLWSDSPVSGYYFVARVIDTLSADLVSYDPGLVPADRQLAAQNVQAALDALASEYARVTADEEVAGAWNFVGAVPRHLGIDLANVNQIPDVSNFTEADQNESISGQWAFGVGITLVGSAWPSSIGDAGQIVVSDGLGQLNWENQTGGGGGLDPSEDAFITGDWEWLVPLRLANGVFIESRTTGNSLKSIVGMNDSNLIFTGHVDQPYTIRSLQTPTWNDGIVPPRPFLFADQEETITAVWRHSDTLQMANDVNFQIQDTGGIGRNMVRVNSANLAHFGNSVLDTQLEGTEIDLVTSDLRLNNAPLNDDSGLIQLTQAGKVPASLLPFTALEFQGVFDASSGSNPADGVDGGEFYVINVAGTLTIFTADDGTPVATNVEPGDYLLWLNSPTVQVSGWYYVTREAPVFIDSDNVTYDPSNERWTEGTVQDVLDEISERVGIRDEAEVIAAQWTFSTRILAEDGLRLSNNATIQGRNAADDANTPILRLNTSNQLELGHDGGNVIGSTQYKIRSGFSHQFYDGSDEVARFLSQANGSLLLSDPSGLLFTALRTGGDAQVITTNHEHSAAIRLHNDVQFQARNAADDAWYRLVHLSPADLYTLGQQSFTMRITALDQIEFRVNNTNDVTFVPRADGSIIISDRNNNLLKAGFRNPFRDAFSSNQSASQNWEGRILHFNSGNNNLTIDTLEVGTMYLVMVTSGVLTLIQGGGLSTFRWLAGVDGTINANGATFPAGSIFQVQHQTGSAVNIWGNGFIEG